ncbi:enoyl-CoA hydratase/carnithine racemase [Bradyrhizobium elkanii]
MAHFLIYEQQGAVVTLTMNEPAKRNPLTGKQRAVRLYRGLRAHQR